MQHEIKYVHSAKAHNIRAAEAFLPILIKEIGLPRSVVDVGCGTGTWLHVFKKLGVEKILGIDGDNVDAGQLHIDQSEFKARNLTRPVGQEEHFELAVCLEVAEHLPESVSDVLVSSLCSLSDTILFSAAPPNQGGQNHINEQPFDYWREKFNQRGYLFKDVFRSLIWNDDRIDPWYRQNIFLVQKVGDEPISQEPVHVYYHPAFYALVVSKHQTALAAKSKVVNGDIKILSALKILLKSMTRRFTQQ